MNTKLFQSNMLISIGLLLTSSIFAADIACKSPVQSWSNTEKMSQGDFSPNVFWKDVTLGKTSIGYGPSGFRHNETTIIDGKVYFAHPDSKGKPVVKVTTHPDAKLGSAMLQIATPKAWIAMPDSLEAISSFDDLNFVFDDVVDDLECNDDVLLPFKIVGHANNLTMSLDTDPEHLVKDYSDKNVVIIGLYNRDKKEKYFMVKGYNLHAHVLIGNDNLAGHLRNIDLAEGATLYLAKK